MPVWGKIIAGCWVLFILFWIISAWWVKPTAESLPWYNILAHRLPTMVGALLLLWRTPPSPFNVRLVPQTTGFGWAGAVICFVGLLGAIWSRTILGRNWSSDVLFKQKHELIEKGPYRFVRHPIYTALLTMFLGSAIAVGQLTSLVGLCILFVGFWIKLRQEETLLTRHFPAAYPEYRKRVKALIPFVF